MTMVESLASGKPVIALRRGGALEIVSEHSPVSGVLFDRTDTSDLEQALQRFESIEPAINARELQESAARFSESVFQGKFRRAVRE
jgi:glycosyltransferase involved in cell wall biosynthesis